MTAAWALCLPLSAQAARPFTTEDAGVLDRGDCEAEPVVARDMPRAQDGVTTASFQLACGVGARTQLAASAARATSAGERETSFTVSGKSNGLDGGDRGLSLALAYAAAFARRPGSDMKFDSASVGLAGSLPLGRSIMLHGNVGVAYSRPESRQATTWAMALEAAVGGGVDAGFEVFGQHREDAWLGTVLRWSISDRFSANLSFALQPQGTKARQVSAGVKLSF